MPEPSISPRDKTDAYSFENLISEGLDLVQKLSGDVWTDYNLHDPGVTLLEQLCFALTDVVYRSDMDASQYLINEQGKIDLAYQGLYGASKVLSSGPVIPEDFESLFLDKIESLNKINLNNENRHYGEFQIASGIPGKQKKAIGRFIETVYHANRPLCHPVSGFFRERQLEYVSLAGVIEIDSGFQLESIVAEAHLHAENYISPAPNYTAYDELLAQGHSLESILQGPFVAKGTLNAARKSGLLASSLSQELMQIRGVKKVSNLQFRLADGKYCTLLENADENFFALPIPDSDQKLDVELRQNGKVASLNFALFIEETEQQRMRRHSTPFAVAVHPEIFPSVEQDHWPLDANYPIHYQMPANYSGAGNHEISPNDKRQQANNRQLNAYLMLFEQFIANNFANLSQIKSLFSIDEKLGESYFHKMLDYPEARNLYQCRDENELEKRLHKVVEEDDNFLDRRNRALDYLLALYAETFPDEDFLTLDSSSSATSIKHDLIRAKIALLKNIPRVGFSRLLAQDVSQDLAWPGVNQHSMNMSGVQLRASLVLGLWDITQRSLLGIYKKLNLELTANHCYEEIKFDVAHAPEKDELLNGYILNNFYNPFETHEMKDLTLPELDQLYTKLKKVGFFEDDLLSLDLVEQGTRLGNYRLVFLEKLSQYLLVCQTGQNHWLKLGEYNSKNDAIEAAELYQQFLYNFDRLELANDTAQLQVFPITLVQHQDLKLDLLRPEDIYDENSVFDRRVGDRFRPVLLEENSAIDRRIREHFRPVLLEENRRYIGLDEVEGLMEELKGYRLFDQGLDTEFLKTGTDASRYRTEFTEGQGDTILAFRFGENRWVKLAELSNPEEATDVARLCQQFLYALNRFGEGMHIVEHGLFNINPFPEANPETSREEIYQLSVVLPNWLIRFESRDFQVFVECLIQQSCPAHISCNFYWLGFEEMQSFEKAYSCWYRQLSTKNDASSIEQDNPTTDSPEQDLKQFLSNAKKNSEMTIETGVEPQ